MSDTCIVCLGDLSTGPEDVLPPSSALAKSPIHDDATEAGSPTACERDIADNNTNKTTLTETSELIAHLIPCGHDLHNECLKPWVERANSCPICRASFHLVELKATISGPVISTYPIEDRTQVAELDPAMFLELPEDDDEEPCQACGEDDNENVLMYCDGCSKLWHTYCVGLSEVPHGAWFCANCSIQRQTNPRNLPAGRAVRPARRRTRGQQRRQRQNLQAHDASWNRVWQSVWSRLNLDLDFPYDDDDTSARFIRQHRQRDQASRQAHDAWLRRARVAELNGAGTRFRESEPVLTTAISTSLSAHNARNASPAPRLRSEEEISAWNAFDQARASPVSEASSRRKKRKASTPPPITEDDTMPMTIKKRRVTPARTSSVPAQSSVSDTIHVTIRHESPPPRPPPTSTEIGAPSFLQSLLQEVEDSSSTTFSRPQHQANILTAGSPPAEHHSPRPVSPALSPQPSNHSSPRATSATPPPASYLRPGSPAGLSSTIQPVYPLTNYSPLRTNSPEPTQEWTPQLNGTHSTIAKPSTPSSIAQPAPKRRVPLMLDSGSSPPPHPPPQEHSPTRANMSLSHKQDVQKLVSAALKPHYNDQIIDKDQYTNINRDVSRMLYDKIGDFETLGLDGKAKWEKVAGEEVDRAINALKASV